MATSSLSSVMHAMITSVAMYGHQFVVRRNACYGNQLIVLRPPQDTEMDQTAVVAVHQDAQDYLSDVAQYQGGYLVPGDLTRPSCPPLQ